MHCEAMFKNKTALNKHLTSSAHRRLSVLCPWCLKQERTFTRIYDLEVHVRSHHSDISWKGHEYFTRTVGFYYALYPEDYARIVEYVVPYGNNVSSTIRNDVRKWAEGFQDKKERLDQWNKGWKDCIAIANARPGRNSSRSLSKEKEKVKDSRIVVAGEKSGASNIRDSDRTQTEDSNVRKRKGTDDTYMAEKFKRTEVIDDGLDGYDDDIELMDDPVELNDALNAMVESMGNETLLNGDLDNETVISKVTKRVGAGGDVGTENRNSKKMKGVSDVDTGNAKDKVTGRVGDRGDVGDNVDTMKSRMKRRVDDEDEEVNDGPNVETGTDIMNSASDSGVITKSSARSMENVTVVNTGDSRNTKDASTKRKSVTEESLDQDTDTESSSSSSSSSSGGVSPKRSTTRTSESLRTRAMRILAKGAMPLCPPARRLWTKHFEMELSGKKFMWPPANWRALSADSRLLAMEQMALTFERGDKLEFPRISRKTLVDKYAFLMLEGQAKPIVEDVESEKVPDKLRQYYFSYLKGLIKGDIGDSLTAWSIVKSLDRSDRWTDTDEIIDILEEKGIKVKV